MRKVYNLKLEIDSPVYQLTNEEFCEGLKEVITDEMGDEIKYVKLTAECVDKDKQIAQLKAENERLKKYETIYYLNQLQASNEDIDKFKQNQIQQSINISYLLKNNTKQVCEKIRKELSNVGKTYLEDEPYIEICIVKGILDQIEKSVESI